MKPDKAQTYDKERVQLNTAKLKKGGQTFEIDIDPDKAIDFKEGKEVNIKDILKAEKIFSDVKKGLLAPENLMKDMFKTENILEIAKTILEQGQIQLTAEYRQMLRDRKKKMIINKIASNGVDPRTGAPHPASRIESAMDEANVKIDEFKSADQQLNDILKKLRPIIPISFETKEIELAVEHKYASQAYGIVKQFGKILKDNWGDGWTGVVEVPAGMVDDLFDKLNSLTHGNVQSKILKVKK